MRQPLAQLAEARLLRAMICQRGRGRGAESAQALVAALAVYSACQAMQTRISPKFRRRRARTAGGWRPRRGLDTLIYNDRWGRLCQCFLTTRVSFDDYDHPE